MFYSPKFIGQKMLFCLIMGVSCFKICRICANFEKNKRELGFSNCEVKTLIFNKIDAWSLPANSIQTVKLFNFVRTFVTCDLDIPITTF